MKTKYIFGCLMSALAAMSFVACSDEDEVGLLRPAVDIEDNQTSVSSLTFWWPDRGDAVVWEYTLSDEEGNQIAEGEVEKDGTRRITFTGLKPDTKYTFSVTAVSATGERSTSVFTAKTDAVIALTTPTITSSQEKDVVTVTWDAISNASYYYYEIKDAELELWDFGKTTDTEVVLSDLDLGNYTVTVQAFTGSEAYSNSEIATYTFVRELGRMWYAPGTYTSADGNVYHPTIYYLEDGSYIIEAFNGVVDYNLCFKLDAYKSIIITNGEEIDDEYWRVKTGDGNAYVDFAIDEGSFSGTSYSGEITMNTSRGEDKYEWQAVDVPDFSEYVDIYVYNSSTGTFSGLISAEADVRGYTMTFNNFLGSKNTFVISYDPVACTASTTLATGWNAGPFNFDSFGTFQYIYYYGDTYCSYSASSKVILIQFYGYVTYPGDHYWMTLYVYPNDY